MWEREWRFVERGDIGGKEEGGKSIILLTRATCYDCILEFSYLIFEIFIFFLELLIESLFFGNLSFEIWYDFFCFSTQSNEQAESRNESTMRSMTASWRKYTIIVLWVHTKWDFQGSVSCCFVVLLNKEAFHLHYCSLLLYILLPASVSPKQHILLVFLLWVWSIEPWAHHSRWVVSPQFLQSKVDFAQELGLLLFGAFLILLPKSVSRLLFL